MNKLQFTEWIIIVLLVIMLGVQVSYVTSRPNLNKEYQVQLKKSNSTMVDLIMQLKECKENEN